MDTLFVVTHVPPAIKLPDIYRYIGVAGLYSDDLITDLTGDSIASLNYTFCELTALYWVWKNYHQDPEDMVGLLHYRRLFFDGTCANAFFKRPLSDVAIKKMLTKCDLIVASPMPLVPNLYLHYRDCHFLSDLDLVLNFAEQRDGASVGSYKKILGSLSIAHMFNMFICPRKVMNSYCEWLFPILFKSFNELNIIGRSQYHLRAIGFLSERLFNLWIHLNPDYKVKTAPVLYMHKSPLSNVNRLFRKQKRFQL